MSEWTAAADRAGFLVAYPQGLRDIDGSTIRASARPVDDGLDELVFVSRFLDDAQANFCVDPRRIDATGISNGGGMTAFLACALAHRVAVLAPVAGNYYPPKRACPDTNPVPILLIHGAADPVVPYNGGGSGAWILTSVERYPASWAARDGCDAPAQRTGLPGAVERTAWTGCRTGAEVLLYWHPGGHIDPPALGANVTTDTVQNFFNRHPLAQHPRRIERRWVILG
ncbi:hypothetical protein [Lapillicoccus sp.]|uniref:alpha/beta hydrolase family esterase n=1 Tax=Lapillicoccus sp. TaxID=1909287 RepID=UPI003264359D